MRPEGHAVVGPARWQVEHVTGFEIKAFFSLEVFENLERQPLFELSLLHAPNTPAAAAPHLRVYRQTVCYYDAPQADGLPVWVWLGREPGAFFYGLPAFGRPGAKLAWHRSVGTPDDPDDPGQDETAEADRFAAERVLPEQAAPRIATERCLFTMTADDRFLLGPHPAEPRLLLGAACSGHGFKLGPLTGRVLAELATAGRSTIAAFEDNRGRFSIPETPT